MTTHPRVRERVTQKPKGHSNIQTGGDIAGAVSTPEKGTKQEK